MINLLRLPLGFSIFIALLLAACASPKHISMWKDPSYKGQPEKIMIISVDKDPLTRQVFEEEFVKQLKAHGAEGVASYTVLSAKHQEDPDAILAKVEELRANAVLITRLLSKEIAKGSVPVTESSGKWKDYYGYDKRTMYPPGIIAEDGYIVLETRMYKAANIEMVWSVTTKAAIGGSFQQRINSYIDTMVQTMVEQGLLVR
jgi:nitrogen regulatory protein PII-like uncharacterized protein